MLRQKCLHIPRSFVSLLLLTTCCSLSEPLFQVPQGEVKQLVVGDQGGEWGGWVLTVPPSLAV